MHHIHQKGLIKIKGEVMKTIEEKLVQEVLEDFEKRQVEKRSFEAQWQLNMNFVMGNQYCGIGYNGDIEDFQKQFFWQEHEVYNHIAPLVERRLAKLQRVRPSMTVVPSSGDEKDIKTAKISKKIVNSIYNKLGVSKVINEATKWSEICGTAFYKVIWNSSKGNLLAKNEKGEPINSGEIEIMAISPFEIYPESVNCLGIEDCRSLIHAKAYHVDEIKNKWGVEVKGKTLNVFSLDGLSKNLGGLGYHSSANKVVASTRDNYAVVIERYEAPSIKYPNGRLVIVAGNTLVYVGELPFINGEENRRGFPFIRQASCDQTGSFWGTSVIERVIPLQRSYNAIKNRKHEFLNRLAMGVLTVEDGSVDTDNLEEEGLCPGKVLVYRQGSSAPRYMSAGNVPLDFAYEEEKLLNEFMLISGTSDILNDSTVKSGVSGTALQLLIEQDESRISVTAENIRTALKEMAKQVLRLYKQYATLPKLLKVVGENGDLEVLYFNSSDITSDEVVFETENEINESLAQRRSMVFELLNAGLLHDENGKLSNRMRIKALELLGFGIWENSQDINEQHQKRASKENALFLEGKLPTPCEIDNHKLHIEEHTSFILANDFSDEQKEILLNHIRLHKEYIKLTGEN